jgi:ABC-type multidrug transport system ATPase subunit
MTHSLLVLRSLTKSYQAGLRGCTATARALDGIHLQLCPGEVVAIVGSPGAGKTTLLLCASGVLMPDSGTIDRRCGMDTRLTRTAYLSDPIHVRAPDDSDPWDVALIDNVESVRGDVARAFALLSAIRRAHEHGAALLLATRDAQAVQKVADRLLTLERGRLAPSALVRPASLGARVAEQRHSVDRDSGGP